MTWITDLLIWFVFLQQSEESVTVCSQVCDVFCCMLLWLLLSCLHFCDICRSLSFWSLNKHWVKMCRFLFSQLLLMLLCRFLWLSADTCSASFSAWLQSSETVIFLISLKWKYVTSWFHRLVLIWLLYCKCNEFLWMWFFKLRQLFCVECWSVSSFCWAFSWHIHLILTADQFKLLEFWFQFLNFWSLHLTVWMLTCWTCWICLTDEWYHIYLMQRWLHICEFISNTDHEHVQECDSFTQWKICRLREWCCSQMH